MGRERKTLKTLADALSIRAALLGAFELAEECGNPEMVRRLLTFVVVGAGTDWCRTRWNHRRTRAIFAGWRLQEH